MVLDLVPRYRLQELRRQRPLLPLVPFENIFVRLKAHRARTVSIVRGLGLYPLALVEIR